mmetsp:Transcript_25921/g.72589  ORF Transcript_25921/g.72589 Transcript_25921/m.72589 type:complete len:526 (-) Transcript_25921:672-2249(-)
MGKTKVHVTVEVPEEEDGKQDQGSKPKMQRTRTLTLQRGAKPNAIPVEFADMRERLMADFKDHFCSGVSADTSKQRQRSFRFLADRIWLANRQRLNRLFQRWSESYRFFNPDQGGVVHPKETISDSQFGRIEHRWKEVMYTVLEKAGFARLDDEVMLESLTNRALGGMNLIPPPEEAVSYEIFYRGVESQVKTVRNMATWYRKRTIYYQEYDRLLVLFKIKAHPDDFKEKKGCCGLKWPFLVKLKNMFSLGGECVSPVKKGDIDPQLIHMKIFKDVKSLDVDMMIPGSSMEFTWLDVAMIWIPTLIGIYSSCKAIYDIWGTQQSFFDWLVLIVLLIMPFSWGYKTFVQIKAKENEYMVNLGEIYMTQNLNNNQGVCGDILEEAHEQENNEALLAYFFLWGGGESGQPFKEKGALDKEVEEYLAGIMQYYDSDPDIDFDVGLLALRCRSRPCPESPPNYPASSVADLSRSPLLAVLACPGNGPLAFLSLASPCPPYAVPLPIPSASLSLSILLLCLLLLALPLVPP